ncbi:S-adenosylmethionine:tRNA ribosyltransferase-isomerase [Candidatus Gracilibacteria bacterium]|nr:S-adenosylmethionine:tRNA ribosyltransferase-isomerase [Candidatus Gracilibacteria bacterium]
MPYNTSDYHYDLPQELIAQEAIHPHHNARLLVVDKSSGGILSESTFYELDTYIPPNRVLFFNNSRVIPSRLRLKECQFIHSGGHEGTLREGEIFFLSKKSDTVFEALVKPGNKFKIGTKISAYGVIFHIEEFTENGRIIRIEGDMSLTTLLKQYGELPLPPYIEYSKTKEEDYQAVFAKHDGSVAAPTASLHFTEELLEKLPHQKEYVTLHVGLGTFQGISTEDIRDYMIHKEEIEISLSLFELVYRIKAEGKGIVAVGTTVTRTLESLIYLWKKLDTSLQNELPVVVRSYWNELGKNIPAKDYIQNITRETKGNILGFETQIYITPDHTFTVVDDLITNFHLPESSLIVLVSSFLGYEKTMNLYKYAREKNYRFFSFGDGMYIKSKSEIIK